MPMQGQRLLGQVLDEVVYRVGWEKSCECFVKIRTAGNYPA